MGINIASAPDALKRCLNSSERKKLGRAAMTSEEGQERYRAGQEKELQKAVCNYLKGLKIHFDWDRMDKRHRGRKGRADFRICYRGRWISCECKAQGGIPTREQAQEMESVSQSGGKTLLCYNLESLQCVLRGVDAEIRILKEALERDGWRKK